MPVLYKYQNLLQHTNDTAFDAAHEPGAITPYPGIYRCVECGACETCVTGGQLPPSNHHEHTPQQRRIRWQLVASH